MSLVETRREGAVCILTLSRAEKLNALSSELERDLGVALDTDEVRSSACVVLTGAGRAFSAGADITEFRARTPEAVMAYYRETGDVYERVAALPQPTLSAIAGYCLGGGLELAMSCDVRVCSDDAQLGQPEVKLGLIPGGGGTQRLPRLVGPGRAALLNLGGEFIDASTAYGWGLVEKVVPRAELDEAALAIARTFASRSPHAIAVLRELARTTRDLPLEEGLRREAEGFRRCIASEDGLEGISAFIEKREPNFTGR